MLMGSVSEEGNSMASRPTEAQWRAALARILGDAKATALIAAMKKAHPEKSIRTLSYGVGGLSVSATTMTRMAKMKYDQKAAPVFAWYFTWQSPMLEDAGAWHTAELAFCFDNTKRCEQGTGNTPEAQKLAKTMATAWANFARTGNPSQPGLTWAPFDPVGARPWYSTTSAAWWTIPKAKCASCFSVSGACFCKPPFSVPRSL